MCIDSNESVKVKPVKPSSFKNPIPNPKHVIQNASAPIIDPRNDTKDNKGDDLVPYTGRRGGEGCINTSTGKIDYGDPTKCGGTPKAKKKPYEKPEFSNKKVPLQEQHKVSSRGEGNELLDQLREELEDGLNLKLGKDSKHKSASQYVLSKGKQFKGMPLPSSIVLGGPADCFVNATKLVINRPDLNYAEGYVKIGNNSPILHAWTVSKDGKVIDNTLPNPKGASYMGIVYPRLKYLNYINKTKHYGVLGGKKENAEQVVKNGGLTTENKFGKSLYKSIEDENSSVETDKIPKKAPDELVHKNKKTQFMPIPKQAHTPINKNKEPEVHSNEPYQLKPY